MSMNRWSKAAVAVLASAPEGPASELAAGEPAAPLQALTATTLAAMTIRTRDLRKGGS